MAVEAVVPSTSVLAENPVVWVDKVVEEGKAIFGESREGLSRISLQSRLVRNSPAKYNFRPVEADAAILAKYPDRFPSIALLFRARSIWQLGHPPRKPISQTAEFQTSRFTAYEITTRHFFAMVSFCPFA